MSLLDNNWERSKRVIVFLATYNSNNDKSVAKLYPKIDLLYILISVIYKVDREDVSEFVMTTQLDFKEPET